MFTQRMTLSSLKYLHIMVGNACNHRCVMCFQEDFSLVIDPEIIRKQLAPAYPHLEFVLLQGGEPTILPQARELVDRILAVNEKARFGMMTNGHRFDGYWQDLFTRRGRRVSFSLNAATQSTYDRITRRGDWAATIANLDGIVRRKREAGAAGLQIAASFVVLNENLPEMSRFIQFCRESGVDQARIFFDQNLFPTDRERLRRELEESEILAREYEVEGLGGFAAYARSHLDPKPAGLTVPPSGCASAADSVAAAPDSMPSNGWRGRLSRLFRRPPTADESGTIPAGPSPTDRSTAPHRATPCPVPFEGVAVEVDGRVRFCCMTSTFIGDLHRNPIDVIWNNKAARAFREQMISRRYRDAGCEIDRCQWFE
jgi:MoaA/NifB/PqqE/SkfB family radical SAM enzyme